jgi:hypothetical protein
MLVVALLTALALASAGGAQTTELHVLFVGNSLTATNDLPAVVAAIGDRAGGARITYRTVAPGGVSLEDHWTLTGAREALDAERWDAVVLQQGPSALPESQTNLLEWAQRWADAARERGARPALFSVWPETTRPWAWAAVYASYANAAAAADAELYPAGVAWKEAWRRDPKLALYGPDGFHPSRLGTYLAALVVYGGLAGKLPATVPRAVDVGGRRLTVTARTAKTLRAAAAAALATSSTRRATRRATPRR